MKHRKDDPALAELPAPITLTPEDLEKVATETGASISGGLLLPVHYLGYPVLDAQ